MTTPSRNIPIEKIQKMVPQTDTVSDEQIADMFDRTIVSYNADAAGLSLLALACTIAHHRPKILARVLREPINCMVCMGVKSLHQFWDYARYYMKRDAASEIKWQQFNTEALLFFNEELSKYDHVIVQLLKEEYFKNTDNKLEIDD